MISDKKVLVVVPARGGSKGIKLKNLAKFRGKPLVALVGEIVKELEFVDRAVVSTDHLDIARIAKESGLDVPFMRPKHLAGDTVGDVPVLCHALTKSEERYGEMYDVIVMLQPTSPLRRPKHVRDVVEKLVYGGFDSVMTISETDSKAHPLKQLVITGEKIEHYDDSGQDIIVARQLLSTLFHRNGAAYAFTRDCLMIQKRQLGFNGSYILINEPMVNIDTELDLELAHWLCERNLWN